MLLTEPLLSCPCCVFGVIVMLKDPATTHLQCYYWGKETVCQISWYMAPSILPSIWCSRPIPFAEKHPQSMVFPPPCFMVGMVFLGLYSSFFFLQTRRVEFIPKSSILVSSDHMTFSHASSGSSRWSLANFRQAWTCAGLSRGTLRALQDFNPWRCSVTNGNRWDCGPSSLQVIDQVLPCSSSMIPYFSLVLPIVERFEYDWLSVWTGVFYTGNEFKQVQLIQVMSSNRCN